MPYIEHKYIYMYIYMCVPCKLGEGVENKLKNEVKIKKFPLKMSIKSNIWAYCEQL